MNLKLIVFLGLLVPLSVFAQNEPRSLYFSDVHPLAKKVKNQENYYGTYADTNRQNATWVINEHGIFTKNTFPLRIPKKKVRESSDYTVKNGYLFGVANRDSLLYFMRDSNYVVGIENKQQLASWDNKKAENTVLEGRDGALYLHYPEGRFYTITQLKRNSNQLIVSEYQYEQQMSKLMALDNTKVIDFQGTNTLIIKNKKRMWRKHNLNKNFKLSRRYYEK